MLYVASEVLVLKKTPHTNEGLNGEEKVMVPIPIPTLFNNLPLTFLSLFRQGDRRSKRRDHYRAAR